MQLKSMNVVALGGGHGLGRVLSTLSFLENKLTGVVTTTDNGGSTGKLRRRSSTIAWGDLRNCLTQLAASDSVGSQLMNFRFGGQDELTGHNLGNLILYALNDIHTRPLDSITLISNMLRVKTSVHPMSETPTDLMAFYSEGRVKVGELSVDDMVSMPDTMMLAPLVKALPETINAIKQADVIIIGPGSFLTSVVPPLLVKDISKAIKKSRAHCIYIDNIIKEESPAGQLTIDQKLAWLKHNLGFQPIDLVISENSKETSQLVKQLTCPLASDQERYFHDKDKLIGAIEQAIEILTPAPTLKTSNDVDAATHSSPKSISHVTA
ncbi:uridine diphosphate-N-acetylglucosamine-binding protein YvcK [Thalassotalea ponticola]|uniref:gluconeogenesis factor YvcK family protein n=1 Tax=Thalassotalea ponticola TaxID=1523392 RepID=UPI0025B4654E|nr:uridine diphosphate-N-acetylglucosamine-binding protein YvcK [Thalassotalea ponticola]MDN3652232.1 uridine diphosphate-N-acetylglucosamine-binding protein YvcK [Thalassotalea ponticola]